METVNRVPIQSVWLAAVFSIISSVLVAAFIIPDIAMEVILGMAGPLVVAIGSFVMMDRTYRRNPEKLSRLLVSGFICKMVAFGAYVVLATTLLALDVIGFIGSFTVYFVVLHIAETVHLQRLYAVNGTPTV